MNRILETISNDSDMILALSLGPLVLVALIAIVWMCCRASIHMAHDKEQSRREIAAYVAEGSMSAADGERLLQPRPWYAESCSINKLWGGGKSESAERPPAHADA